jgi:glutamate--cysteine ligase
MGGGLATFMNAILDLLKDIQERRGGAIESWLAETRAGAPPFIYTSVDLRHSGLRLAPVDTNLFPAGFHNLSPAGRARASRFLAAWLAERYPQARNILLIPESHTRNLPYLDNLAALLGIFAALPVEVRLGTLSAQAGPMASPSGVTLAPSVLKREGETLGLEDGFVPDLIVMNYDMTAGVPGILQGIAQPVEPPPATGWWRRRKSAHFAAYRALAEEFARLADIDPWRINACFHGCGKVDFKDERGLDCVARGIEKILLAARAKHEEYGIAQAPYAFVKADSGTYGMGVMTVRSPDDIFEINKKTRNKMQVIKEGTQVSEVIVQEGIPTADQVEGKPAEPMVYLIDGIPAGGMFRVNGARDALENLNASGVEFTGMCDEDETIRGGWEKVQGCHFRAFGLVAAIAALAVARE